MLSERFVLAVIDVHLPDGFGFELVPELKRQSPGCRVLVASGLPCHKAERLALEAGADRFAVSTAENVDTFVRGEAPECGTVSRARARTLEEVKTDHVNTVLLEVRGNRSAAAQVLGIKRQSLQRMLRKSVPYRGD